jgi:hypothetical protein
MTKVYPRRRSFEPIIGDILPNDIFLMFLELSGGLPAALWFNKEKLPSKTGGKVPAQ